ncbi:MAG: glycerophosphodiester phosphodiesterase [Ignavibacteria bacterium]|jgi:glycerophosphoryl diester phosphodiesterase
MSEIQSQVSYNLRSMISGHDRFIVAHRGSSGTAPENTMASLQAAIESGVLMVEVDVQLTKDDEVVLMHDPVLGRTTNGTGIIRSMSYADLKTLDAGSWFNNQFTGEHIPLLSEALQFLNDHETCVNIEIKPPQKDDDHITRLLAIVETVIAHKMQDVTLFSSFHHESLKYIKKHYSNLHTAGIHLPGDKRLPSEVASEIGCEGFVCSLREITHAKAHDAGKHDILMGVYTINDEQDFKKIMKYKVPALVTNFPKKIHEYLQQPT